MFIGHFAVGLGAKKVAPQVSLGILFLAAQFLDLLWPTFLLMGIEKVEIRPGISLVTPLDFVSYPISHSLLMAVLGAPLVGWIVRGFIQSRGAGFIPPILLSTLQETASSVTSEILNPVAVGGLILAVIGVTMTIAGLFIVRRPPEIV